MREMLYFLERPFLEAPFSRVLLAIRWFSRTLDVYIYVYIRYMDKGLQCLVWRSSKPKGGDLGVYVRLLPTVYNAPSFLALPFATSLTAHLLALPIAPILPTDIHSRRPSLYPSDVAGCYIIAVRRCQFYQQRATLPTWTGVPCRYSLPACLPACLSCLFPCLPACLPVCLPTYLSTYLPESG